MTAPIGAVKALQQISQLPWHRWSEAYDIAQAALDGMEQSPPLIDAVVKALRDARPLVEKWCHYQGNAPELFAEYLSPIDAALSAFEGKGAADAWQPITTHKNDGAQFLATWEGTNQFAILKHDTSETNKPPTHWQPLTSVSEQGKGGGS